MRKGTIRVFLGRDSYMVNLHNASNADEVFNLFGTYVLPCPYTLAADSAMVERNLARLNPNDEIVMDVC